MSIEETDAGDAIRSAEHLIEHVQLGYSSHFEPGNGHYDWPRAHTPSATSADPLWNAASGPADELLPRVAELLRG